MEQLINYLANIYPTDRDQLETYSSGWKAYSAPKKTILTTPDTTEGYLYFVHEGIQKSYYLHGAKQHVMFFAYAPSFSGVVESFLTQTPSRYFLETITDSHFFRISYEQHQEMVYQYREIETLFRKITEMFLAGIIERHHEFLAYSAEERLAIFLKRSPHLLNMVSQKDLASYLRIDPTNFSKMVNRNRM
ncbi:MAG: Crp/Fnr family transcriptional regulator [Bacteroidota bacterium]